MHERKLACLFLYLCCHFKSLSFVFSGTCHHLPVFNAIPPFFPFPNLSHQHHYLPLPPSTAAMHESQPWDIAFLILLTGDNIYVLFFDIHFSCSHRSRFGQDTIPWHKHMSRYSIPPPPASLYCANYIVRSTYYDQCCRVNRHRKPMHHMTIPLVL